MSGWHSAPQRPPSRGSAAPGGDGRGANGGTRGAGLRRNGVAGGRVKVVPPVDAGRGSE